MPTLAPMNRARKPCSSQWGALRRFVTRISTSKLTNQAHAPQSAAAARTLCLPATLLALLSQSISVQAAQIALEYAFPSSRFLNGQYNPHQSVEKLGIP